MLCRWGIKQAADGNFGAAKALGCRMGKDLYVHLGFTCLGSVTVQVEGEDEKLTVYCLEYTKEEDNSEVSFSSSMNIVLTM